MTADDLRKLAWFIWRNYPPAKEWGRELLWNWLRWVASEGFVGVILDENHKIVATGIARPVMDPELAGYDSGYYDYEGDCVYADLAIAPTTEMLKALSIMMRKRFGIRNRIAFKRNPDPLVRVYDYRKLMRRHLFRKDTQYGRR